MSILSVVESFFDKRFLLAVIISEGLRDGVVWPEFVEEVLIGDFFAFDEGSAVTAAVECFVVWLHRAA